MVDGRKVKSIVFQSSQEAFLDFNRTFKTTAFLLDEEQAVEAPIETILNFYWCWSKRDSWPYCKIEFLDKDEKPILTSEIKRKTEFSCLGSGTAECVKKKNEPPMDKWIPVKKAELKDLLGDKIDQIKSVHMYQDEKTDAAWGFLFGLYAAEVVAVVSMLAEIPISYALDKPYNWKHVGIATLAGFVGVSVGSSIYIAMHPNYKRLDVTIKF